jgi:hypothetical protein
MLIGQPADSPLREHVLMISAEEIPLPDGVDSPSAIFMGGWDHHENTPPKSAKMLVFMYPYLGQA